MHSRMFTITTNLTPINDYPDEVDFDTAPSVADYVEPVSRDEWKDDIAWLANIYPFKSYEKDGAIYLTIDRKEATDFVGEQLNKIKSLVENMTIEDFIGLGAFRISKILGDEFGFYIMEEGCCGTPVDLWIRDLINMNKKTKKFEFQIIGVADYHA